MTQTRTILGLEDISRVDKCLAMFFYVSYKKLGYLSLQNRWCCTLISFQSASLRIRLNYAIAFTD
jgi:hypothetical protein